MSTTAQAPAAKRLPITIKTFNSSAAYITLRRWPDRVHDDGTKEPGGVFVEVAQDSGKRGPDNKAIWNRVSLDLADVGGVIETLSRAKTLGIQTEDSR